jgi:hypothetical protein
LIESLIPRAIDIIISEKYSIFNIYIYIYIYGTFTALLIVIAALIGGLIVFSFALGLLSIFYKLTLMIYELLLDQVKFRSISLKPDSRPKTTTEAIQLLHSFKSDWCKV